MLNLICNFFILRRYAFFWPPPPLVCKHTLLLCNPKDMEFKLKTFIRPYNVIWISQICKYARLGSGDSRNTSVWEKCFIVEKVYLQCQILKYVCNVNTEVLHSTGYYHLKLTMHWISILKVFKVTKNSQQKLQSTLSVVDSLYFGQVYCINLLILFLSFTKQLHAKAQRIQ